MINRLIKGLGERHSVRTVVSMLILPVLLVVMLSFGMISGAIYRSTVSEYVLKELQMNTDTYASYLNHYLSEIVRLTHVVYMNTHILEALEKTASQQESLGIQAVMSLYSDVLNPLFSSVNNPPQHATRLYLMEEYFHADFSYIGLVKQLPPEIPVAAMIEKGKLDNGFWWVGNAVKIASTDQDRRMLFYARVLYTTRREAAALLVTEISVDHMAKILAPLLADGETSYRWQLSNGQIIFESQAQDWAAGSLMASSRITVNQGALEVSYSGEILQRQQSRQFTLLAVLVTGMASLSFSLIRFLCKCALKRLEEVVKKHQHVQGELPPPLAGRDEAAILDQNLTATHNENRANLNAFYKLESTYRAMEYQMLMSKINPHFLYNTLSAIKWSLQAGKKEEAAQAVDMTVAFYRGILSHGSDVVMLDTELDNLREYIGLQSYTYSRQITLETEMPLTVRSLLILKFLLQPIFENAIQHTGQDEQALIRLQGQAEDCLVLRVWNSGPAISQEMMTRLNAYNDLGLSMIPEHEPERSNRFGYGVFNVIARIRLLYGPGYGLWYSVPREGGTMAEFRLPILPWDHAAGWEGQPAYAAMNPYGFQGRESKDEL